MDTPEMTDVSIEIEFLGDNRITRSLLQIKTRWRDEITSSEEVCEFRPYVPIGLGQNCAKVLGCLSADVALTTLTVCEGFVLLLTHILGDLGLDTIETFLETFLDNHTIEETGKEDFVMLRRIGVVRGCSA